MTTQLRRTLCMVLLGLTQACGGSQKQDSETVVTQTAADEILRIAADWTADLPEQGLLSAPSVVSMFKNTLTSTLTLTPSAAQERLIIEETLQLRAGGVVRCTTTIEHPLSIRYGRRQGEAAIEIVRPAVHTPRTCSVGTPPEPMLDQPERRALFVLRADTLVPVEPPLEKRKYLPMSR
ncbi:MAG TPA: hypothetical protein VN764_06095 [Polyangiaceae bacterium]|nr:hypothetical protein [Polyangiaceae bacterium]